MALSNTTLSIRKKAAIMQKYLQSMVVAREISDFQDGVKFLTNPYETLGTVQVNSPVAGTYTVGTMTTTDNTLEVNKEALYSKHVFDFESRFAQYNLAMEFLKGATSKIVEAIDRDLFTNLGTNAGETVTVANGFTSGNVIASVAEASGKLSGYSEAMNGLFIVIGNSSLPAFQVMGATNGFSFADSVLKNGLAGQLMGFDLYVVRDAQLPADTALAGIKRVFSTGTNGGIQIEEKGVSGKTGKEFVAYTYYNSILWNNNLDLVVKFDLA